MKSEVDCMHCYLKQAVNTMALAAVDDETQYRVLFELMDDLKMIDQERTPAENSTEILLKTCRLIGSSDPYLEQKKKSNALALGLYPELKATLDRSPDRIQDALKISAAGNVIDLGINKNFDIDASLKQCLEMGFSRSDYSLFLEKLNRTEEVVIVGDNSGEIVFDRLLAEELSRMGKRVVCLVKGGPIINDATLDDALQAGMEKTARIVTTGSNFLGAILHRISAETRGLLQKAELIISKGQANFETLEHEESMRSRIFFLLKIKCECVGKAAEAKLGDVVFITRR